MSVIANIDAQPVIFAGRLNFNRSTLFRRVHRVENQIQKHLDQLISNNHHQRHVFHVPSQNLFPLLPLVVLRNIQGGIHHGMDVTTGLFIQRRSAEVDQLSQRSLNSA